MVLPLYAWAALAPVKEMSESHTIRVRLAEALPKAEIHGFDLKFYELSSKGLRQLAAAPDRQSRWELRCGQGQIFAVSAKGGTPLKLHSPVLVNTPAGFLNFQERPYHRELKINAVGSFCEVVNHVDLEKYLAGLVNSEFSSKWNQHSIEAQVVAARTYAYFQMRQASVSGSRYDVDATVRDQVYDGSMKEDPRSASVVEHTRGWVLTVGSDRDPKPLKAFYHASCGGVTELPENVWGRGSYPGFKHSVQCPFCADAPRSHWNADFRTADIAHAFEQGARASGGLADWPRDWLSILHTGRLFDVRVAAYDPQGRVSRVVTSWTVGAVGPTVNGTLKELAVSGPRFREWMGATVLKSAAFQITAHHHFAGNSWFFEGRGNGHGVGMCQWGAKVMGERGYTMAAILKHYYPDAILRKLW